MDMNAAAATTKPVLPPISGTPSVESSTSTNEDALSSKLQRARTALAALHQASDGFVTNPSACTQIIESLVVIYLNKKADNVPVFSAFEQEGLCELCMQTWKTFGFQDQQQLFLLRDNKQKVALSNWISIQNLILAGSDTGDSDIISHLVSSGLIKFFVELLETELFHPSNNSPNQSIISMNMLGTLYNMAKKWDRGVETIRSIPGSDRTVAKYTFSSDPAVKTMATIVLTFLLNEEEQKKMLESTDANIKFMIHILENCLKSNSKNHVGQFGYSAAEIMDGLTRMAATEVNKEKIVSGGALPFYARVLDSSGAYSAEEQEEACKGLWTLAFSPNNKAKIAADVGCIEGLRRAAASSETLVRNAAEGALWVIEGEAEHVKALTVAGDRGNSATDMAGGHIMLSYNWAVQQQVIRIKEGLRAAGHRVWIDVESMSGSTLEAMSKAVEEAWLVLIFFTEKYKLSSPCRLEAEYTYNRGKKFIPIKMESGYKPDGWLGMLLASRLFFDFTKDGQWEVAFNKLCAEIARMKQDNPEDVADGKISTHTAPTVHAETSESVRGALQHSAASYSSLAANSWREQDIQQWLTENRLDRYAPKFSEFSGRHLIALRRLMDNAPEFFYQTVKQELGFVFLDLLTFSNMLQALK